MVPMQLMVKSWKGLLAMSSSDPNLSKPAARIASEGGGFFSNQLSSGVGLPSQSACLRCAKEPGISDSPYETAFGNAVPHATGRGDCPGA